MLRTPLTSEPATIYSGDSISWLISVAGYPASDGWTLKYNGLGAAGQFGIVSSASGDSHSVEVAAADVAYPAGDYTLVRYVEHSDGSRVTLGALLLTVKADLAAATAATDTRSHVKKVLDAIEAVLEGRAATDQLELTINGHSLKRTPVADLLSLRSRYLAYWKQEQQSANLAAGIGGSGSTIQVRFK